MDEGAEGEVVEVLVNRRAPLRLGYVMVKNRSQRDVDQGIKLQQVHSSHTAPSQTHILLCGMLRIKFRMCL